MLCSPSSKTCLCKKKRFRFNPYVVWEKLILQDADCCATLAYRRIDSVEELSHRYFEWVSRYTEWSDLEQERRLKKDRARMADWDEEFYPYKDRTTEHY